MNWYKKELKDGEDFEDRPALKMEAGSHTLKILEVKEVEVSDFNKPEEKIKKLLIVVVYNNIEHAWFVTMGETKESLYGQLVELGKKTHGLINTEIEVIVAGSSKSKRYSVKLKV